MNRRAAKITVLSTLVLASLALSAGCVYFNTFYFARRHFADGEYERLRAEAEDQALPAAAMQSYQQSLQFASRVLAEHPDSKWVEEALLISQKVLYRQGDLAASVRKGEELLETFPESAFLPESQLYRAMGLADMGAPQLAATEAAQAATELTGELRAEALLVESLALAAAGELDRASRILDDLIAEADTPPELVLRARLDLVEYLEQNGEYTEASEILQTVLADPSLSQRERERAVPLLISLLLRAGETAAAETWIAELETMNIDEFYSGLLRYFRARLLEIAGYQERARNEMVMALVDGVTAQWEARIRLSLAHIFEAGGFYMVAGHEYRAITQGLGTEEQRQFAARRYDAIMRLYTLRSLAARAEGLTFSDPRGISNRQNRAARPGAGEEIIPPRTTNRTGEEIVEIEEVPEPGPEQESTTGLGNDPPGIYLLLLAEHFALEMDLPDSAAAWIDVLRNRHADSPLIPRALFALHEWFGETGGGVGANAAAELLRDYPQSRWAYELRRAAGEDPLEPAEIVAENAWLRAEQLVDPLAEPATWSEAVDSLRAVARRWPDTEAGRRAALEAAQLLEFGAGPLDSARVTYEYIAARYPDTAEGALARQVLGEAAEGVSLNPLEIRTTLLAEEAASWANWFANQQPARVTRLQPRQRGRRHVVAQDRERTANRSIPPLK